jgi:hypothetical protein
MLEAAEGYAVFDREGKRLGVFLELVRDQIAIRHEGFFIWHRRLLPITAVADVIPDQGLIMLTVSKRALVETEAPARQSPETSDALGKQRPSETSWQERVDRFVGPVADTDQSDLGRDGAELEPSADGEDMRLPVAGEEDPLLTTTAGADQPATERHLLFIATPTGYSLAEQEGPPPRRGDRIEIAEQAMSFLVVKLGRSPLPNDRRSCAYLEPTASITQGP